MARRDRASLESRVRQLEERLGLVEQRLSLDKFFDDELEQEAGPDQSVTGAAGDVVIAL